MKKKKEEYKFVSRKHSIRAIVSGVIGGMAWCGFMVLIAVASAAAGTAGTAGTLTGLFGVLFFIASVAGLINALISIYERDIFLFAPIFAIALNASAALAYFFVYLTGL